LVGSDELLPAIEAKIVLADKAYDADARVIEPLRAAGKQAVIPPRKIARRPAPTIGSCIRRAAWWKFSFAISTVPRHRDPLRQNRAKFPRRRFSCFRHHMLN